MAATRISSLDGLRGIAALVVVCHHLSLTTKWFADRVGRNTFSPRGHFIVGLHTLLEYTPIHLFFAGTEAVYLFFVLSGFVLVNAIQKNSRAGFLSPRLTRLYFPILGAVVLASLLLISVSRNPIGFESDWLIAHAIKFHLADFFRNIWVLDGTSWLDSSLWSMQFEIIFSLLVIALIGFSFKPNRLKAFSFLIILILVLALGDHYQLPILSYLPIFFAGCSLHFMDVPKLRGEVFICLGMVVIITPWMIAGFGYTIPDFIYRLIVTIGACFIVQASRGASPVISRLLDSKPLQTAGKYSYSLYLIHAPVLVTIWYAMGPNTSHIGWLTRASISIVCIAMATSIVYHFFEKPALAWSHRMQNEEVRN